MSAEHATQPSAAGKDSGKNTEFGPWNPGLESRIPAQYLPLSTMFRPETVFTAIDEARELADLCGMKPREIVAFRPERLIVHELLIRVSADLTVPDGPNYEDLGINLRSMAGTIYDLYIAPDLEALKGVYSELRGNAIELMETELSRHLVPASRTVPQPENSFFLKRLFGQTKKRKKAAGQATADPVVRLTDAVRQWKTRAVDDAADPFEQACLAALARIVGAIVGYRGRLVGDAETVAGLAANLVCNGYGSIVLGEAIEPNIRRAVEREGYRFLPPQEKPVVMNVKGASASGKSTIRPQQQRLAERLGIPWEDFAVISPDYWRKFLLDYDSLEDAYKYAAMLTGHELEIIDRKLDRYMAAKAAKGPMSHLLIDRFRFDSFVVEEGRDVDTPLLTRFGDLIFMFFMITPPEATVERAWIRGIKTGRYKAVDDLLYHNIEAYTGMPHLFFSWASVAGKRVHYEFLDNSVAENHLPRTVAFGWNGEMTILDVKLMLDIERFRSVNIEAKSPDEIFDKAKMAPGCNAGFLKQCAERIPVINFADHKTGHIYGRLENSDWTFIDADYVETRLNDPETIAGLKALGWADSIGLPCGTPAPELPDEEKAYTLGDWSVSPAKAG